MQAKLTLAIITAPYFQVLNTQFANGNSLKGFSLHISTREQGEGVNENSSFIPTHFGTKQNMRCQSELHFPLVSSSNHKNIINPITILLESQYTATTECCKLLFPGQDLLNNWFGCPLNLLFSSFVFCFVFFLNSNSVCQLHWQA